MSVEAAAETRTVQFFVTSVDTDRIEITNWGATEKHYVDGYSHVTARSDVFTLTWTTTDPPAPWSVIVVEMHPAKGPGL